MSAVSSKENGKITLKQRNIFFFLISKRRGWAALGRGGSACWTWREQEHLKSRSKIRDGSLFLQVYSWISTRAWIQPLARCGLASLHAAAQQQTRSSETTAGIMSSCEEELGNPAPTSFQTLLSNPSSSSIAEELGVEKKGGAWPQGMGFTRGDPTPACPDQHPRRRRAAVPGWEGWKSLPGCCSPARSLLLARKPVCSKRWCHPFPAPEIQLRAERGSGLLLLTVPSDTSWCSGDFFLSFYLFYFVLFFIFHPSFPPFAARWPGSWDSGWLNFYALQLPWSPHNLCKYER